MLKKLKARAFIYYEIKKIIQCGLGFLKISDLIVQNNIRIKVDCNWYDEGQFEIMENIRQFNIF